MSIKNPYYTPRDKVRIQKKTTREDLEARMQQQLVRYVKYQYPKVIFKCDLNGVNLSIPQYKRLKAMGNTKGHPDLVFYEPRQGFHGLFLELKPDRTRLYTQKGTPTSEHIKEQLSYIEALREKGYKAEFAVGFEQAKAIVDAYLA